MIRALLWPVDARRFRGQRALRVAVRTMHIGSAGVTLGAATLGSDAGSWPLAAAATGALLVADDLYRYGLHWLRWLQSWALVAKLSLLAMGVLYSDALVVAVWTAVAIGGVISHAPGKFRQYALWGTPGPCALRLDQAGGTAR